jgi:hypothetical protein
MNLSGPRSRGVDDDEMFGVSRKDDGQSGVKVVGLDVDEEERKMDVDI